MGNTMKDNLVRLFKVLCLVLLTTLIAACSETDVINKEGVIVFGTGIFEEGITEQKDIFTQSEDILIETDLSEPFGTSEINFILLKDEGGSETIYDEWPVTVDPSWSWFSYEMQLVSEDGELETGDYILRMFKNSSDLISEGAFSVQ